ncbi:MAG: NAD-dependent epimerase/dehydratase family protein [Anaerolineae bacterium]|nr:NAD-dependent epimerase/dehydratase family protein [Anaerolineae bacterium]
MAKYLVSGAAGFIGSRVSEMLLSAGHEVVGVDNHNNAYDVRLKDWRLARLSLIPGYTHCRQDITDFKAMETLFNNQGHFDGIINLAARAGVRASVEDPWIFVNTNVTGTLNLLEMAHRTDVPKFVQASTSSIYGANAPVPTAEDADSSLPLQPYSASKKGAEAMCHSYHFLYDLDVTIFRFFTVYGPAGRPDMVMFRFIQWITEGQPVRLNGDGEQSRGFTYVDDIANGVVLGLKPLGYEIINLGGHETITMNAMITELERLIGRKADVQHAPMNKADMLTNWANVEKAGRLLGWKPQFNLQEGMRRTVEWYMAQREWANQVLTP